MAQLEARRKANFRKQVHNDELDAGSPMHYYCKSCTVEVAVLPECHTEIPPRFCAACAHLKSLGLIK